VPCLTMAAQRKPARSGGYAAACLWRGEKAVAQ
jgi:hypothetical protein